MTGPAPVIDPAPLPGEAFRDLPARLRDHAQARPDAVALVDGAARITARDLVDRMDRVAAALVAREIGPGCVVATLAGLTADHVAVYLGTVAAGAAIAPLPVTADAGALDRMIDNSGAQLVLADDTAPSRPGVTPLAEFLDHALRTAPQTPRTLSPTGLFDILYSSGTTGHPKGIEHDARFRDRQIMRLAGLGYGPQAVHLAATPVYSNTTLAALLPALGQGARVVLLRRFDEAAYLRLAEAERATHTMLVPVQYKRLLEHRAFDAADLSAFVAKLATSAPFGAGVLRAILDRWPGRMINIYGMTEGGISTLLDATAHPDKLHTVGRPVAGGIARILRDDGSDAAPGEPGEIVGRSPTMMCGYRATPDATRDATWTAPTGEIYIRTGDIGLIDNDGFLILKDRKKDVIISGGFNIYASDLEAALTAHPAVAEAAVVAVPSDRWGETPVAAVVLAQPAQPDALLDWVNGRMGRTQRLADLRVVESLPRSDIGKVLKRTLRALWDKEGAGHV